MKDETLCLIPHPSSHFHLKTSSERSSTIISRAPEVRKILSRISNVASGHAEVIILPKQRVG